MLKNRHPWSRLTFVLYGFAAFVAFNATCYAKSYLSEENKPNKTVKATPISQIKDTAWQLSLINVDTKSVRPDMPSKYTLQINAQGTVAVQADCNRATGAWQSSGDGAIQFGPLAATKALCPPDSLHDPYLQQLSIVSRYHIDNGQLILGNEEVDMMIFTSMGAGHSAMQIPKSPDEGGPLSWQFVQNNKKFNL